MKREKEVPKLPENEVLINPISSLALSATNTVGCKKKKKKISGLLFTIVSNESVIGMR